MGPRPSRAGGTPAAGEDGGPVADDGKPGPVAAEDPAGEGRRLLRAAVDLAGSGRWGGRWSSASCSSAATSAGPTTSSWTRPSSPARRRRCGAAPVVVDVEPLAAALPQVEALCGLRDDLVALFAQRERTTRIAAGLRLAVRAAGRGAVCVVGRDPAALAALVDLDADPALVLGLPGGWAGVVEAKRAVRDAGLPALTNRSRRGGTDVAAAALEALLDHG